MQVRALQGSGGQKDPGHFEVYGKAGGCLAEAQLQGVERGDLAPQDLSSVRMLLKSMLKQVKTSCGKHHLFFVEVLVFSYVL